ncbi:succinate-semialdehyde dehydrogenase/glutarate-semialdehyde dehydrogenase [Pseudomonas lini]|uniref:NAD-dependent succinate-semialdehyde dehydrogenase n=1 Tax=Pseudomonas lini TaxID=163011 RepID=UPI00277D3B30|nr:NAD-dependent succinate-semialdehyde dehydrogenase [Pseudomonas lini]MDQ0126598.1 succinate-semialdehyde dehydrogenase/glutarate-semialdehyde dehydrogenase [Pseudomonas lini]
MYTDLLFYIDGQWTAGSAGNTAAVLNPSTGETLGQLPLASSDDLDTALAAAASGFETWSATSAFDRSGILRRVAALVRDRHALMAECMTLDQGKPLAESTMEAKSAADHIEWYAEEGRRAYGRIVPSRHAAVRQLVVREPVGPVAAFTPWNFPINQAVRKIAGALAAGCSIIIKGPEEAPGAVIELVRCFHDAGVPKGVLNLVFGNPAHVSEYLIRSPVIRKVSFTGSTAVGRQLGALAATHLKLTTMELGGHAPFIVCADADVEAAAALACALKFRNAGQVCASPSRFYVHDDVFDLFARRFTELAVQLKVGDGFDPSSQMGPLANARRLMMVQELIADARDLGATVLTGGNRIGATGHFFEPTLLTDLPKQARLLNEEPFGPVAPLLRFNDLDSVIAQANSLEYGLAAFAFTRSLKTATELGNRLQAGMVSINHFGLALPETPFGGIKASGHGSEGGTEGLDAYLTTKFISQAGL